MHKLYLIFYCNMIENGSLWFWKLSKQSVRNVIFRIIVKLIRNFSLILILTFLKTLPTENRLLWLLNNV